MIDGKTITLIIPCKNEEASLYSMLNKVPSYVDEVIVVDNNSTDNTPYIAKKHGARLIQEKRIMNGVGYGYAHQSGMKAATGDIIVAMDGDDTYPIEAIKDIVTYLEKSNSDFVSCARFPLMDGNAISPIRQLGVHVLNLEVALLYGYNINDILTGMWAMRKNCVDKLQLHSGDWNFSPEIKLAAIANKHIHFSEYHIEHNVRLNGMSKQQIWQTGFQHLFYILQRRFTIDKSFGRQQMKLVAHNMRYILKAIPVLFIWKSQS